MEDNKKDEQLNTEKDSQANEPTELEKTKQERDEYLNGWKRAKADLINYQKDDAKRTRDALSFGAEQVMKELIPVLDSMELGIAAAERVPGGQADKGLMAVRQQLADALRRQGLERIPVSPGDAFDVTVHESLGEMDSDKPSGTIAAEVEAGYTVRGKVVRPVRVKLAK